MMRILICGLISALTTKPAVARTLSPGETSSVILTKSQDHDLFAATTSDYPLFYQFVIAPDAEIAASFGLLAWFVIAMAAAAIAIARTVPESISDQAFIVALARSWTRWIMARKPFERWDDRWSRKSSRVNSASASTAKTSRAESPL